MRLAAALAAILAITCAKPPPDLDNPQSPPRLVLRASRTAMVGYPYYLSGYWYGKLPPSDTYILTEIKIFGLVRQRSVERLVGRSIPSGAPFRIVFTYKDFYTASYVSSTTSRWEEGENEHDIEPSIRIEVMIFGAVPDESNTGWTKRHLLVKAKHVIRLSCPPCLQR